MQNYFSNKKRDLISIVLLSIFITAMIQILMMKNGYYGFSADENARTLDAWAWVNGEKSLLSSWLPGTNIIVGSAIALWKDLVISPRIISIIFGIITVLSIVWLSWELFNSKRITILSTFLIVFSPERIVFNGTVLAEVFYLAFLLLATASFIKWLKSDKQNIYYIITVICIALSSMFRYEGWIFSTVFFILSIYYFSKTKKISLLYFISTIIVLSIFPLVWMLYNYIETGDPFYFFHIPVVHFATSKGLSTKILLFSNPFTQFFFLNLSSFSLIGLSGYLFWIKNNKEGRTWAYLQIVSFFILCAAALAGKALPSHSFWRIQVYWTYCLIPFYAWTLIWVYNRIPKKQLAVRYLSLSVVALFLTFMSIKNTIYYMNGYGGPAILRILANKQIPPVFKSLTKIDIDMGRYLKSKIFHNMEDDEKIWIESNNVRYGRFNTVSLMVASNGPSKLEENNVGGTDKIFDIIDGFNFALAEKKNYSMIVVFSKEIKDYAKKSERLSAIYQNTKWSLYRINY